MSAGFEPTWVTELDLEQAPRQLVAPDRMGRQYSRVRCLLRRSDEPLGCVDLPLDRGTVSAQALTESLPAGLDQPPAVPVLRPVSVVVCTHERPRGLAVALDSILRCKPGPLEVLVVDSAPRSGATARVVDELGDGRLRLLRERRRGLSRARNLGVSEARADVIAFTDDDVRVDRTWLRGLMRGVGRAPHVGCVTGAVYAAELETAAQLYFDRKVDWGGPGVPRLYDMDQNRVDSPLYPYLPGTFGAGANLAVTKCLLAAVGGFDEALGVGSPAGGGEDLDLFLRVLRAGMAVAHEPSAVLWHYHRREARALRRQLAGYGSGLAALACKELTSWSTAPDAIRRLRPAVNRMSRTPGRGGKVNGSAGLRSAEVWGMLMGPSRYARGRLGVLR